MQPLVPTQLETERLILRQFKDEDWEDLHVYYSDETATKYTLGRALNESESWRSMCGMIGHWVLRGYGPYALEDKVTGKVMGTVGFWYPNDWPSPEIKWGLAAEYQGKGFASEAARKVQALGKKYLPDISLISLILKDNTASIQLAKAVGASYEREMEFRGQIAHIYRHP